MKLMPGIGQNHQSQDYDEIACLNNEFLYWAYDS